MEEATESKKESTGLFSLLRKQYKAYDPEDKRLPAAALDDSPLGVGEQIGHDPFTNDKNQSEPEKDIIEERGQPKTRGGRYALYNLMSKFSILQEAINIHLYNALAPDRKTGLSFQLKARKPEHQKLVDELNRTIVIEVNRNILNWAVTMAIYGVNYIRPYATEGVGITHFQADYYTLPHFVREWQKAGMLCGFTSQFMRDKQTGEVDLAPPWTLIPYKIPYHTPDPLVEPNRHESKLYSLFDDIYHQTPVETQNYGTSFLEHSLEPFLDLLEGLDSLRASRKNAARIERILLTKLDDLDPIQAAEFINMISQQLKQDIAFSNETHKRNKTRPIVENKVVPISGAGKGDIQIDTHSTSPDIQHITDVEFRLKQLAASVGVDVSMLGWADTMSGGLGEGGFLQTAISAVRRSVWIRSATETTAHRIFELHLWYKYKKAIPEGQECPWVIEFNSVSAAIEEKEDAARVNKVNHGTIVAALIDTMQQGSVSKSPTLTRILLDQSLDLTQETLETVLTELSAASGEEDEALLSELRGKTEEEQAQFLLSRLIDLETGE